MSSTAVTTGIELVYLPAGFRLLIILLFGFWGALGIFLTNPILFLSIFVSATVYPERIVIAAEGQVLCEHARVIERSHHLPARTIYDWRHYLAVIQRKPGALRNGAPFADLPDAFASRPVSSSPPTSASVNGLVYSAMPR